MKIDKVIEGLYQLDTWWLTHEVSEFDGNLYWFVRHDLGGAALATFTELDEAVSWLEKAANF